jgi:hypothetical protein
MAIKPYTILRTPLDGNGVQLIKWTGLVDGDTGAPLPCPHLADESVQVVGTFGVGGNCRIEGSNFLETPTYATLNDPQGSALDFALAKVEQILENTYWVRPNITAGDVTTLLDVYMLIHTTR